MTDIRKKILLAARQVAAREGFDGATMQKIAAEAGLKSPSHIYWYFKNKKELFQSMMEELSPILSHLGDLWRRMDDPPEEVLYFIGHNYLRTFENPEARQLFRIFFSQLKRSEDDLNAFAEKALLLLNFLVTYFDRQIELGRLRPHDTQASARSFLGAFVIYVLAREVFVPLSGGLPQNEVYSREVIEIFLRGLRADTEKK